MKIFLMLKNVSGVKTSQFCILGPKRINLPFTLGHAFYTGATIGWWCDIFLKK